jgi:hypothetical protein
MAERKPVGSYDGLGHLFMERTTAGCREVLILLKDKWMVGCGGLSMKSLLLVAVVIGGNGALHAQAARYLLEETTVKEGMTSRFEPAQGEYCAAVIRGGAPSCTILSPTTFSAQNQYFTLLAFGSFSHYDEGTYTSKGLTPEQAKDLSSRRGPTIANNQESAIELHRGSSFGDAGESPLVLVTEIWLHPGSAPAFLKVLKEMVLPAAQKAKFASFEVYETAAGGSPDRFFLMRGLRNFAELDASDALRAAMPRPQQAEFDEVFSKCVVSTNMRVLRVRSDLSPARP